MDKEINIWVIDDDEINNFLCKRTIVKSGLSKNIKAFQDAREAIKSLMEHDTDSPEFPRVIFLDINMPYFNGWDFLKDYKSLEETKTDNIFVYMLSSSLYEKDISKATKNVHVKSYIPKPLTEEILHKIGKAIGR